MNRAVLFFVCSVALILSKAQPISFSGRLVDVETNEPVPFALLYIDGTTIGVTSDENGNFVFNDLSFPIKIEISHLSYDPKTIRYEEQIPKKVTINLSPRAIKLQEVLILHKGTRKEYIRKFNSWFIGIDQWGQRSKLMNDSALVFFEDPKGFRVGAAEPLIIESRGLGYTVRADLRDFLVEKNDSSGHETWSFISSYHFTASKKNKFDRNRAQAYYNSSQHFLKSLYETKISRNGYTIKKEIINDSTGQKEHVIISIDSNLVWNADSIRTLTGLKGKEFFIQYYYRANGFPKDLEKNDPSIPFKSSAVKFTKNEIILRSDGTTPGTSIQFSGEIGHKRVGAMLPGDYHPPEEETKEDSEVVERSIPERLIRKRKN